MSWHGGFRWKPYVPVAERQRRALKEVERLRKKGRPITPVRVEGREIAATFWGSAWCSNLERYSDYANRLPRGRTYVRNGSVVDLQITAGKVNALVSGSSMYEVEVKIAPLADARWKAICRDCAGDIDSMVELLRGQFSKAVMARIAQEKTGLFPSPKEIRLSCSCPDWAEMCKHVAATLYGVGARLDRQPELLFRLRKVDETELVVRAGAKAAAAGRSSLTKGRILKDRSLSEVFGIDLAADLPGSDEPRSESRADDGRPARRETEPARKNARAGIRNAAAPEPRRLSPIEVARIRGALPYLRRHMEVPTRLVREVYGRGTRVPASIVKARKLQGRYMGILRGLTPPQMVEVKMAKARGGFAAAFRLARKFKTG